MLESVLKTYATISHRSYNVIFNWFLNVRFGYTASKRVISAYSGWSCLCCIVRILTRRMRCQTKSPRIKHNMRQHRSTINSITV